MKTNSALHVLYNGNQIKDCVNQMLGRYLL